MSRLATPCAPLLSSRAFSSASCRRRPLPCHAADLENYGWESEVAPWEEPWEEGHVDCVERARLSEVREGKATRKASSLD